MRKGFISRFLVLAMMAGLMLVSLLFFVGINPSLSSTFSSLPAGVSQTINTYLAGPRNWLSRQTGELTALLQTYEENKALKKKLSALAVDDQRLTTLEQENENLRQALKLKKSLTETSVQVTEILNRSTQAWLDLVTVSKGKADGVLHADLLLSSGAVVGRVTEVDKNSSQVILLTQTSGQSSLAVKVGQGQEAIYGVLLGYDREKKALKLGRFNEQGEVTVGAKVVTSGYDGAVADLPVGQVLEVERQADQSLLVYATLTADMENLTGLTLVGRTRDD